VLSYRVDASVDRLVGERKYLSVNLAGNELPLAERFWLCRRGNRYFLRINREVGNA
jgi:hypothetical protein